MLTPSMAAFLQGGVGIHIGTCNARHEPNGARAVAVQVERDGVHLVVYLAEVAAARLMPDLTAAGQAALSFGRPTDDRACQVKGQLVSVRQADEPERAPIRAQFESFLANLERIGIPGAGAANWVTWPAVAIRLKATSVYEQTPGASAGTRMS